MIQKNIDSLLESQGQQHGHIRESAKTANGHGLDEAKDVQTFHSAAADLDRIPNDSQNFPGIFMQFLLLRKVNTSEILLSTYILIILHNSIDFLTTTSLLNSQTCFGIS